jgi:threonine aldolase
MKRQFGSDNYAGICPEAWEALAQANSSHAPAYGVDDYTQQACDAIREVFETDCQVFFVFNGTAANSLSLAAMCQSYHSVLVHEMAHIEADECGAPEFFSNGTKLLLVSGAGGKVDLSHVEHLVKRRSDIHYPKPRVLSMTQSTECGTVYTREEVRAAGEAARRLGLKLHMDGARLANAVAALGVAPAEITWRAGVDVLSFGMTKVGIAVGEAVVFFNKELGVEFDYRCKQAGQLASKMRFLSAPWSAMLRGGVWLRHAAHANRCAKLLEAGMREIPGIDVTFPAEANAVFARLSPAVTEGLRARGWRFHFYTGAASMRFMCSWDTTEGDVADLLADMKDLAKKG